VLADVSRLTGTAFEAGTAVLEPGLYDAVLRLKLPKINHVNTAPLKWSLEVSGAGNGKRGFDMLVIERAGIYQEIPCRFTVARVGKAVVKLSWVRESLTPDRSAAVRVATADIPTAADMGGPDMGGGDDDLDMLDIAVELEDEPPIAGLKYLWAAADGVAIAARGSVAITALSVDKIRYRPGETATVSVAVRNYSRQACTLRAETVLVQGLDATIPVDERSVSLESGALVTFEARSPKFEREWGYAARCRLFEGETLVAVKSEYFTVHHNMWAVMMPGRGAAQFTAHITPESARASALRNKRRYRNWVESGFWAPDEFGDFTPDTEKWWGGQGNYYGSVSGTKVHIKEGHKVGISFAVYANIWGGDGPPAFEMIRRRPDWGHASTFNVEWLERWDRNPMGTGSGRSPMHVWPITVMHHGSTDEPARHHGRELIGTHRMLGWDAVRYDSHAISDHNARVVGIVKEVVHAEVPEFQFGYNSSVPNRDPSLTNAFRAQCEDGGLIMEEGIRQFGGGGMSYTGGATYKAFAERILAFKEEAREHGGHFTAIGMDKCFPNDLVYQYIFWFAANTHMCYDWLDTSVANYPQFATRFAGLLWDHAVTSVAAPAAAIDVGEAADKLWLWERYVHQRDLGDGRRQLILHLINAPAETILYTSDDCKVPPPLADLPVTVKLPGAATVRGVWFLTAEPKLTQQPIEHTTDVRSLSFVVPRVRFWSVAVADLENAGEPF